MQKAFTLFSFLFIFSGLSGQFIADFENFNIPSDSFLNGSNASGVFMDSTGIFLPNSYNPDWDSWSGWALSNTRDVTTPGFTNQYSSISGDGANGSSNYATTFVLGESSLGWQSAAGPSLPDYQSIMVNNSTYAYLSMKDGDMFAKKFGGETGEDLDYFLLTIKGRNQGVLSQDSINFYLADFRFSDNSQDYIVNEWTEIDVSQFNDEYELVFTLSSSDNGQFGMNTPAYFCLDNVAFNLISSTKNLSEEINLTIFPNPTTEFITFDWNEGNGHAQILDLQGRILNNAPLQEGKNRLNVSVLPKGVYFLQLRTEEGFLSEKFVKN